MSRVPMRRRQTIRSLAASIDVPATSTFRMLQKQKIKRVSSTLKPLLTPENELQRLQFILDEISGETSEFYKTEKKVHLDEKWFYITKIKNTYYLLPDEEVPQRNVQSKRFITKIMFLAAVAQPRYDHIRDCMFDGLVGIWPFTKKEAAKRNSRNRPKGTMETKCIEVNKKEYLKMLQEKVIPAIRAKFPQESKEVLIQHDNATPHAVELTTADATTDGWNMTISNQPPNSPDFNVLDLGFFNSIQSLQQQKRMTGVDELIKAVEESYWSQEIATLENVWLTWQKSMECSLLAEGSNKYQLPHMGKARLRSRGQLPKTIRVCDEAIQVALEKLQ